PRALTEQERDTVDARRGVFVTSVEKDSFAEEIGLEEGDIIDSLNRQPVNSLDDIVKVRQTLKPGDAVAFHVTHVIPAAVTRGARNGGGKQQSKQDVRSYWISGYLPR